MRFMKRSIPASFSIILTAGVLSLTTSGLALAGGSDDTANPVAKSTTQPGADRPGNGAMDSRMAPTQKTTGTGRNPDANSVENEMPSRTNRGTNQMSAPKKPSADGQDGKDQSTLPRMAPTQNTQGNGNNPKANSRSQ